MTDQNSGARKVDGFRWFVSSQAREEIRRFVPTSKPTWYEVEYAVAKDRTGHLWCHRHFDEESDACAFCALVWARGGDAGRPIKVTK